MIKILVVDDEEKICFAFEQFLSDKGYKTFTASNAENAIQLAKLKQPDIVFLDIRLPGKNGLFALEEIVKSNTESKIVVMTAYGTMDTAIQAMRAGAYEYITKPIDLEKIGILINKILRNKEISLLPQKNDVDRTYVFNPDTIIGKSQQIQDLYKMIGLLTTNDVPVLIEGESGVGKELVAQAIHSRSDRSEFPFIAINCGAMPESLMESELFGHEQGAFTGATTRKTGKFEYAGDGTIFLDEIGDLDFSLQVKLLRVLQEKEIVKVGGLEPVPVKARIIAATNKNLAIEMKNGNFRSDLYYRLQLITLRIPPLRERKEDIPELVEHFINKSNIDLNKKIKGMEKPCMDKLLSCNWKGNVRELENVIKRAVIMTQGNTVGSHSIKISCYENWEDAKGVKESDIHKTISKWFAQRDSSHFLMKGKVFKNIVKTAEKALITEALKATENNQVKTSKLLGINRTTLRNKIDEYSLN